MYTHCIAPWGAQNPYPSICPHWLNWGVWPGNVCSTLSQMATHALLHQFLHKTYGEDMSYHSFEWRVGWWWKLHGDPKLHTLLYVHIHWLEMLGLAIHVPHQDKHQHLLFYINSFIERVIRTCHIIPSNGGEGDDDTKEGMVSVIIMESGLDSCKSLWLLFSFSSLQDLSCLWGSNVGFTLLIMWPNVDTILQC